ncbi:MAG: nucleotidyl transferase AbiEii/AbiGii toxin family protein [Gammaproteobacteria bacterium]
MAPRDAYRAQVDLLIRCIPAIARMPEFALKGGTAINLFLHDMPRLSVDIDLTFLPISDRDAALVEIRSRLATIAEEIRRTIPRVRIQLTEGDTPRLLVGTPDARVKVEPCVVIRGSLFPPVACDLCPTAQETYELFVQVQRLDTADLYGGKLCAALDRQHPRDLFDIMNLQAAGEIRDEIRHAFVAYLAGHRRPIAELLAPKRNPIEDLFAHHFSGMTERPIELDELEAARTQLFQWVATALTENERRFLLSIKQGKPDWEQLPLEALDKWPAIQWKLYNIQQMSARSHKAALTRLRDVLGI